MELPRHTGNPSREVVAALCVALKSGQRKVESDSLLEILEIILSPTPYFPKGKTEIQRKVFTC